MNSKQQINLVDEFLDAVKNQEIHIVRESIAKNVAFTPDWAGYNSLHFASINGNLEIAKLLIRAGVCVKRCTKLKKTPLHLACQHGQKPVVDLLLRNNAELEAKDIFDMTPLHWASERGHIELIEYLCKNYKFDFNLTDKFGRSVNDLLKTRLGKCLDDFLIVISTSDEAAMKTVKSPHIIKSYVKSVSLIIKKKDKQKTTKSQSSTTTTISSSDCSGSSCVDIRSLSTPQKPLNSFMDETLYWLQNQIGYQNTTLKANFLLDELKSGRELCLTEAGRLTLATIDDSESARNLLNKVKKSYEEQENNEENPNSNDLVQKKFKK